MATLKMSNANDYVYNYSSFDDYSIRSLTAQEMVLRHDEDRAGRSFEAERDPWEIIVTIVDAEIRVPRFGEWAGDNLLLGGRVAKVVYRDEGGAKLLEITDITLDAGLFHLYVLDEPWRAYDNLVAGGSTFTDNSSEENGSDFQTSSGDDVVRIKAGSGSYTKDRGGSDRYLGHEESYDTISYDNWYTIDQPITKGLTANLKKGWIDGPDGNRDVIRSIDEVRGTHLDDRFVAKNSGEVMFAGLRGEDTFVGGNGFDRVRYDRDDRDGGYDGIEANLAKGYVIDGFGTRDTLVKKKGVSTIESVRGSNVDDVMRDDKGDNYFEGREGDDTFYFRKGNDRAELDGGADTVIFLGNNFGDENIIEDFNRGEGDQIEIRKASSFDDLTVRVEDFGTVVDFKQSTVILENVFDVEPGDFGF